MKEISQEKINKKLSKKKDSFKLRKADRINTSVLEGLTLEQVEERKKDNLTNKKVNDKTKSIAKIFIENIFNFCNSLIIILCIVLICLGKANQTLSSCIIIVNIAIGIYQEVKAKRTVQKLSIVKEAKVDVVRGGKTYNIPTEEIVLDDIFILSAGQQVPVDGVILDGTLEIDESILTGESEGVKKDKDKKIMAGSVVIAGEAAIRAERVGKDCYIEAIANIAKKVNKPESRLFNVIDKIIKVFSCILVFLAIILAIANIVAGNSWQEAAPMVIYTMLGMVPCGMFVVTSTALAQSVLKLAKTNALPQDIYSVEMIAMVDTLLLDKTGTITDGNLEVLEEYDLSELSKQDVADIIITLSESNRDKKLTAMALNKYCESGKELQYIDNLPFSSQRKYSAVQLDNGKTYILGAPDLICPDDKNVEEYCHNKAIEGKRTILLGEFDGSIDDIDPSIVKPICVFAIEEELKKNIKDILAWFSNNDVDIKIISGDNPLTVSAIAKKAGVLNADKVVNCSELTDEELKEVCSDAVVFGRVSPEQKVLIVEELKKKKHIVGMVGDGVNDVKALKASNCSISFGNANEVARNISRIVLLDNDFQSMPRIVEEGRRVIGNIEKVSSLFIMKNIFIMTITFIFSIVLMVTKTIGYPFSSANMLLFEFFVAGIPPFLFALMPNQERIKGNFLRNVIKVSIPAALSIIIATCFIFILNATNVIEGEISEGSYVVSLGSLSMTLAAFICAFFVALPWNKIRVGILILAMLLAIFCVFGDGAWFDGAFLQVQWPTNIMHVVYVVISGVITLVVNLIFRQIFKVLDKKYGDVVAEKFSNSIGKTRETFEKIQYSIKTKFEK